MTNIMLNTQLYQKMYAEQEQYKAYLLTLPPNQILDMPASTSAGRIS